MDSFAFIIHPIDPKRDVSRKYPLLGRYLSEGIINFGSTFFPPVLLSEVSGITSQATGKVLKGWLIACPLTAARMIELNERIAYYKIIQTGRLAERLGADILGLGAFTSVVGDGGISIANALDVPVTTGDAYTIAVAVQAIREAAALMEIDLRQNAVAIVGATGAIGRVCAQLMCNHSPELHLFGRDAIKLEALRAELQPASNARLITHTDLRNLRQTKAILTVSSAVDTIIQPEFLQPGSVICDVARPRDVAASVAAQRQDVLVIDGGIVDVPGQVDFHFDFGFPPGKAYACMAETIALALEGRFEDYTIGKEISIARVTEISEIAQRHGFKLSGFRSFEKPVSLEQIEQIKRNAKLHS
ncbi:MAG TPA: shikimate dehydrogenase [Anaerolineales bacterium]|nr:shikimate dehydrogenase [Anaerolineales bacterium]